MKDFKKILTNEILPLVNKPGRYLGNELNVVKKDWSRIDVTFALIFPDLYELGMSYIGFEILYHILNRESYVAAERVFAPDKDLEAILKERSYPLFSLENKRALNDFDVIGFTIQYELHYTNILNILDLGQIEINSKDRKDGDPLVIAGGPCTYNPEPLADYIDAFIIGDGEEISVEIARFIKEARTNNMNRQQILKELSSIKSVYVPQFYDQASDNSHEIVPIVEGIPTKIEGRIIEKLDSSSYPNRPLVPIIETTHDRFSMEIMRGCSRGCRFCNAGIIYRPVRERSVFDLIKYATNVINNTGYEELSLLSLSTSDYGQLDELMKGLSKTLSEKGVNVSFPSLRSETFTPEIAKFARSIRKSGITLAPEAGTEHLQSVINKNNRNEDLLRAVRLAFDEGWKLVKLYFMIGLPQETDDDLQGIVDLVQEVLKIARLYRDRNINVSISPFSPKPHTPFQWAAQNSADELNRKISFLKERLGNKRIKFNWRDPRVSFLEAVMGRGDRDLSKVIRTAWENGAKFDAWSDMFRFDVWQHAFEVNGIDPKSYIREKDLDEKLPWDHIFKGVTKSFLKREYEHSVLGKETPDCRLSGCHACGLMHHDACQEIIHSEKKEVKTKNNDSQNFGRTKKLVPNNSEPTVIQIRLQYSKKADMRYASHLDMIRLFDRSFRRANLKLVYTQGFHPHPKIAYGPSLPTGYESESEYLDIHLYRERDVNIDMILNRILPEGIRILKSKIILGKNVSLVSLINRAQYKIKLLNSVDQSFLNDRLNEYLEQETIEVFREKKGGTSKSIDIKPFIDRIELNESPDTLFLSTILEQGKTARVSEILGSLLDLSANEIALAQVTRLGLFIEQAENSLATPMEVT